MRPVSDFLAGIASGVRGTRQGSCLKRRWRARTTPSAVRAGSTFGAVAGRFVLLLLGVSIGAVALLAAGGPVHAPATPQTWTAPGSEFSSALLPAELTDSDPSATPREWKYIVLHHSASQRGSLQSFDAYHRREKGWRSLGYHFVIGNGADQEDGLALPGPRWFCQEAGAHANSAEYNEHGIGICLVGHFDEKPPTPAQLRTARALIVRLSEKYHIPAFSVVGHNQIRRGGTTACPGKLFPLAELRLGLPGGTLLPQSIECPDPNAPADLERPEAPPLDVDGTRRTSETR